MKDSLRRVSLIAWWFIIVVNSENMPPEVPVPIGQPAFVVGPSSSHSECDSQALSIKRRFPAIEIEPCFEADSIKTTIPPNLAPSEPLAP